MIVRGMRRAVAVGVLLLVGMSAWAEEAPEPEKVYADFNRFCVEHFGAEKEPLVYEKSGKELKLLEDGPWRHVSETSACIAFETNLPAKSHVEYGETDRYGKKTPEPERHFYLHLHYLRDLEAGKTVHYRLVAVDERGSRITSEDRTVEPKRVANAVRIPDDFAGAPYVLDKPGATYLLTRDISTQGAAVQIVAGKITLDLNGHTILYDQADGVASGPYAPGVYPVRGTGHGVIMEGSRTDFSDVRILNGVIRQGDGNGEGSDVGWGHNPFLTTGPKRLELAGVTAVYDGASVSGLLVRKPSDRCNIHHNVVTDRGTVIKNRHQGLDALLAQTTTDDPESVHVHHNLVKRTRHRGIRAGAGLVEHNEIYVDSHATNSYGVMLYSAEVHNVTVRENRISGTGYHAIAIGVGWVTNAKVEGNTITLVASVPTSRSSEYGRMSSVNGVRVWGTSNVDVSGNLLSIRNAGGPGTILRGFWTYWKNTGPKDLIIRENTVKLVVTPDSTDRAYCVVAGDGTGSGAETAPVVYRGNTLISNICSVTLGDTYCPLSFNKRFIGNRLVRVGDDPRYCTIKVGETGHPAVGATFIDTTFAGGAGYDKTRFAGTGEREFSVGWTLTVNTTPGAKVTVTDKAGTEVFSGQADADGKATVVLLQYTRTPQGMTPLTPHTVTVEKDGKTVRKTVTVDRTMQIDI